MPIQDFGYSPTAHFLTIPFLTIPRYSFLGEFDTSEANLSYVDMLLDNVNRIVYNKSDLAESFENKLADVLNQLKEKNLKLEVFLWN